MLASEDGGLFAIKTLAGWAVVRPLYMCNEEHPTVNCYRVAAMQFWTSVLPGRHLDHHFVVENKVREIITPQVLNKMFELNFSERTDDKEQGHSPEDKKLTLTFPFHYYSQLTLLSPLSQDILRFFDNSEV